MPDLIFFGSNLVDVWTYDVHEGQEIFLDMLSAVEEMNRIIHSQQNLAKGTRGQNVVGLKSSKS